MMDQKEYLTKKATELIKSLRFKKTEVQISLIVASMEEILLELAQ